MTDSYPREPGRNSFSIPKFDIICGNDMREQRLHFDGRQVPARTVKLRKGRRVRKKETQKALGIGF